MAIIIFIALMRIWFFRGLIHFFPFIYVVKAFHILHRSIFKLILLWCIFLSYKIIKLVLYRYYVSSYVCIVPGIAYEYDSGYESDSEEYECCVCNSLDILIVCRKHMKMGGSNLTMLTTVLTMLQKPLMCDNWIHRGKCANKIFNNYI